MKIEGSYQQQGYALIRGLIPAEVAQAIVSLIQQRKLPDGVVPALPQDLDGNILTRRVYELYGNDLAPMKTFLWGLTPAMEQVAGRRLVPTYNYFRLYRDGDLCLVHRDRPACEHSMSLTLGYSDDEPWPLELGLEGWDGSLDLIARDFGTEPSASLSMQVGDAVAYRGVDHRHGRTTPNPNRWSAHLFLHWVDPDGPHKDQAFDGKGMHEPVDFTFA
ncbi:hypothetical protein [Sphingomonas alba]|uniref:Fe2OG dioxygenase domain-containing protein n=1 Tax=Sphingomonas alba TaxID=2908208 RepID=A0ABT0RKJ3_9SPHN|nr:hypothetical protein [Sphingomonas alba]MCL6683161.1 hypothetical protein [Sphingomonas alba]